MLHTSFIRRFPARFVVRLIRLYQLTLSPDHGPLRARFPYGACKFHPTCSMYAVDAIEKFGLMTGIRLAIRRVFRCHPWSAGGFDPVQ